MGSVDIELKDFEKAIEAVKSAIRLESDCVDHYCCLSALYLSLQKRKEALDAAREALRLNSASADAYLVLGCAFTTPNLSRCSGRLQSIAETESCKFEALANLGDAYHEPGQTLDAKTTLLRAQAIDAADLKLHRLLGEVYVALG